MEPTCAGLRRLAAVFSAHASEMIIRRELGAGAFIAANKRKRERLSAELLAQLAPLGRRQSPLAARQLPLVARRRRRFCPASSVWWFWFGSANLAVGSWRLARALPKRRRLPAAVANGYATGLF